MIYLLFFIILNSSVDLSIAQYPQAIKIHNWTRILTDEWLVEFYAPWCPACQALVPEWKRLAGMASDLNIQVADLDCVAEASVAMVFTITKLPTIFHIKDGVFRMTKGKRLAKEFEHFIKTQAYELIEPEVWSYDPNSFYMRILVRFLDIGMSLTKMHKSLVHRGMPAVFSFILVATGILLSGACFGMFILVICDYCCPPRPQILRIFGFETERPQPLVTKENDTDEDSVLDDNESDSKVEPDPGLANDDAVVHKRKNT